MTILQFFTRIPRFILDFSDIATKPNCKHRLNGIWARINNHAYCFTCAVIIHPCHDWELGHGWVTTYGSFMWRHLVMAMHALNPMLVGLFAVSKTVRWEHRCGQTKFCLIWFPDMFVVLSTIFTGKSSYWPIFRHHLYCETSKWASVTGSSQGNARDHRFYLTRP